MINLNYGDQLQLKSQSEQLTAQGTSYMQQTSDNTEMYKKLQSEIRRLELEINTNETKLAEMEKQLTALPEDLKTIGQRILSATTQEELDEISVQLNSLMDNLKVEYQDILQSIGLA